MHSADILVLGGSVRAVAAALAAARAGRSVWLAAPRLYLGDDMVGTLQLWLRDGETPEGELSTEIFATGSPTTPLRVKKVLAQALVDANVEIRLGCLPVGVTRNAAAARPLHDLLLKPGMRGHALTRIVPLPDQPKEHRRRIGALREIVLARALLRCGDCNQLAKTILQEYEHDLRPLFHLHARAQRNVRP